VSSPSEDNPKPPFEEQPAYLEELKVGPDVPSPAAPRTLSKKEIAYLERLQKDGINAEPPTDWKSVLKDSPFRALYKEAVKRTRPRNGKRQGGTGQEF
jgi:hypothetical protein